MGTIWVREFSGGLDARRLPVNTPGGNLILGYDGHINRGGEFEQRAAFVEAYTLPAGTVGLSANDDVLVVFGSIADPGMPAGFSYQRLQHPNGTTQIRRVLSVDRFSSKFYVIAEFEDAKFFHFYDGALVTDWQDGRARASFTVTDGQIVAAEQSQGQFSISGAGGISPQGVNSIVIDGQNLLPGVVNCQALNSENSAYNIVDVINGYTGTSGYTATRSGATVVIRTVAANASKNGKTINVSTYGALNANSFVNMAGGVDADFSRLEDLQVGGVSIIAAPVAWTANATQMAADIVTAINAHVSVPDYTASAVGTRVDILASSYGTGEDGKAVTFTLAVGLEVDPASGLEMAGGDDAENVLVPGKFSRTVGSKEYALSESLLHFSAVADPTSWLPDDAGAGFVDLAAQASGFEKLTALARYQQYLAVFAEDATMIYFVDPDPDLNRETQVLGNTGTLSPRSVTQFGDSDLFYLHSSGLRSLRARDSTSAAATTDIGSPIDDILQPLIEPMSDDERGEIIGLIEPRDGRFWLAVGNRIFVFTFFTGSKVSAWTIYRLDFTVEHMIKFKRKAYLRSGDTVYVYGGLGNSLAYDDTEAVAQLPFLDGGKPNVKKTFQSYDVACNGQWEVELALNPNNLDALDKLGQVWDTTFNQPILPAQGESTHLSLRFTLKARPANGPARLSSVTLQYEGNDDGDG